MRPVFFAPAFGFAAGFFAPGFAFVAGFVAAGFLGVATAFLGAALAGAAFAGAAAGFLAGTTTFGGGACNILNGIIFFSVVELDTFMALHPLREQDITIYNRAKQVLEFLRMFKNYC